MEKIYREIQFNKIKIGKIAFLPDDYSIKDVNKQIIKSIKKLQNFYNKNISNINIELIYSREELNKRMKKKTPNWLIGLADKNKIYLFSPLAVEKYSSHKKSDLNKIITHELCHIFNAKLNNNIPPWLDEGLALNLSSQKKNKDFKKKDWQFFIDNLNNDISFDSFVKHDGYKIAYWLVKKLIYKYKIKNLLRMIRKSSLMKREDLPPC